MCVVISQRMAPRNGNLNGSQDEGEKLLFWTMKMKCSGSLDFAFVEGREGRKFGVQFAIFRSCCSATACK